MSAAGRPVVPAKKDVPPERGMVWSESRGRALYSWSTYLVPGAGSMGAEDTTVGRTDPAAALEWLTL